MLLVPKQEILQKSLINLDFIQESATGSTSGWLFLLYLIEINRVNRVTVAYDERS